MSLIVKELCIYFICNGPCVDISRNFSVFANTFPMETVYTMFAQCSSNRHK